MKKLLVSAILVCSLIPAVGFAKARTLSEGGDHPNALSLELLGRAGAFSINYDKMVTDDIALGAGLSFLSVTTASVGSGFNISTSSTTIFIIPIYLDYFFSEGNFRPYVTGGFDILTGTGSSSYSYFSSSFVPTIGAGVEYRGESGFLFRAAPYMFISGGASLWVGVSVGYAF